MHSNHCYFMIMGVNLDRHPVIVSSAFTAKDQLVDAPSLQLCKKTIEEAFISCNLLPDFGKNKRH